MAQEWRAISQAGSRGKWLLALALVGVWELSLWRLEHPGKPSVRHPPVAAPRRAPDPLPTGEAPSAPIDVPRPPEVVETAPEPPAPAEAQPATAPAATGDAEFRLYLAASVVSTGHETEADGPLMRTLARLGLVDADGHPDQVLLGSFLEAVTAWVQKDAAQLGEIAAPDAARAYWDAHQDDPVRRWGPSGWQ